MTEFEREAIREAWRRQYTVPPINWIPLVMYAAGFASGLIAVAAARWIIVNG